MPARGCDKTSCSPGPYEFTQFQGVSMLKYAYAHTLPFTPTFDYTSPKRLVSKSVTSTNKKHPILLKFSTHLHRDSVVLFPTTLPWLPQFRSSGAQESGIWCPPSYSPSSSTNPDPRGRGWCQFRIYPPFF